MDKIEIGVIGCGDIAFRRYLPAIQQLSDRVKLTTTCSRTKEHAERARVQYGASQSFTDIDEMLMQAELDAVVILTPMHQHGSQAISALEAGKHVYVEKVMAVTVAEADRMVELADQKDLILACAPATILTSAYQRVSELIEGGAIGRPCFAQALAAHGGPARWDDFTGDPTWFYQPNGGPLFDLGVYPAHILTQILGPVRRVSAFSGLALPKVIATARKVRGETITVNVDDTTLMLLDFGNTVLASVSASYNMLSSRLPAMQFWGSQGALSAPQFIGDEVGVWRQANPEWELAPLSPTLYDQLGIAAGLPHWLDCIVEGKQPVNNGRHGRHVLDILLSAQASARAGQAIDLITSLSE